MIVENNSIFDKQKLKESTCDDKELARQVVQIFLADIPLQLNNLAQALVAGDAKSAERISHSIKGASAMIGGDRLCTMAYECEQLGRDGRLAVLLKKMPELRRLFDELCEALLEEGLTVK